MCHPLKNPYLKILIPNMLVLGNGAFGRWWGHEGGGFIIDIRALIKKTPVR
jgi:hypothetical protein